MSTPRRRYRVDVVLVNETHRALIRKTPGELPWCYCPHTVRATSVARAQAKAIEQHRGNTVCQALDEHVREVRREYNLK